MGRGRGGPLRGVNRRPGRLARDTIRLRQSVGVADPAQHATSTLGMGSGAHAGGRAGGPALVHVGATGALGTSETRRQGDRETGNFEFRISNFEFRTGNPTGPSYFL